MSAATIVCLPCFGADVQGFAGEHSCLSAKKDTSLVHIRCKGNLTLPTVCLSHSVAQDILELTPIIL